MEKVDETRNMCKFVQCDGKLKVAYATAALGVVMDFEKGNVS